MPAGDYNVEISKFGYVLENTYYGPEDQKEETDKLRLYQLEEFLIEVKRIPVTATGRLIHDGVGLSNAELSFSPTLNPLYNLTFETGDGGYFEIDLPPENYMYTFSYEGEEGERYLVHGQMQIPIGSEAVNMGDVETELTYRVSGVTELDGVPKAGMVIFTPVDDLTNATTVDSNTFDGYTCLLYTSPSPRDRG